MRKITASDIQEMLMQNIEENLRVTVGKGKNKKIVISSGFKIKHLKSGLVYTVDQILVKHKNPVIVAHSGDGESIEIQPKDFKQYKGL